MFDEKTIEQVWELARTVEGFNPDMIRKDACGAWIMKNQYGNRDSIYGWEIDHVFPLSMGGTDNVINLRPCNGTITCQKVMTIRSTNLRFRLKEIKTSI